MSNCGNSLPSVPSGPYGTVSNGAFNQVVSTLHSFTASGIVAKQTDGIPFIPKIHGIHTQPSVTFPASSYIHNQTGSGILGHTTAGSGSFYNQHVARLHNNLIENS